MYLDLGENTALDENEIIGIFDLDQVTVTKRAREFLAKKQKDGKVLDTFSLPLSFVVTKETVYLSPVSSVTLSRRCES